MNTSQIRALFLSLTLLGAQVPMPAEARDVGADRARQREVQAEAARRAAARSRQAPQAQRPSAPARPSNQNRNPMTGSTVSRTGQQNTQRPAARPEQRPAPRPEQRPAARPEARPAARPEARPAPRPEQRPAGNTANRPAPNRPDNTPANRPSPKGPANPVNRPTPKAPGNNVANRPAPRPGTNVANRPAPRPAPKPPITASRTGQRPSVATRPAARPAFVPGKVVYPKNVTRAAARPTPTQRAAHPAYHTNRPRPRSLNQVIASNSNINSNNRVNNVTNVSNVTNNRVTNVNNNTYVNNNWGNQWTNNRTSVWNNNRVVNNRPVYVNPNFQRSVNYAYRPTSWGSRPWWSSSTYHSWHQGSWNYGWNRNWRSYHRPHYGHSGGYYPPGYGYHDHDHGVGTAVAWGLAAWTLGSLAYDTGYNSYRNPYQAPPVQTHSTTVINYSQPLSVVAAQAPPEAEEIALTSQEKSTEAIERARAEFSNGDYLAAQKSTDEAISYAPGDSALHEFRALCLFALGRYGDAAGVLNPLLASGPGWDWATMADFYPDSEVYTGQLRKLEAYVDSSPDSADSAFLLGYHYLVAGFIDESYVMFDRVVTLQPADTVAVQLRNLAQSTSPNAEGDEPETLTGTPEAAPAPLDAEEIAAMIAPTDVEGGWKAASADGKSITLTLEPSGKFAWNYEGAADGKVLAGDWSIDEEGQLVLAADDVQMIADISLEGENLQFVLAGSPVGDPGLSFKRL